MRHAGWSLPLLVSWLVACPLVALGVFTCHGTADADGLDCCQPLEGGSRTPAASALAAFGAAPSPPSPLPVLAAVLVEDTATPPGGDALQAVLSVYRI